MLSDDVSRVIVTEKVISERIRELAKKIDEDYPDGGVVLLGVLKGSFMFFSDLVRCLNCCCWVDFIATSSYGSKGTVSSGAVELLQDTSFVVAGKDLIIVDDILDTGTTMKFLSDLMKKRNPSSLELCVLLDKPSRRSCGVSAKYVGFEIPDEFVVGYGLGYDDKYRNLPYVGVLKEEIWRK